MTDPIRMHVQPALEGAPLLLAFEGWNDAGEAATHAARFVADAIQAVPLAELDYDEFLDFTCHRPRVALDADGERRIEWPKMDFRYGSVDGAHELVVGVGIEPHLRWRQFCELMLGLVRRLRVSQVVFLGAYLAEVVYSRPVGVTGSATSPERLRRLGVVPSGYQGPTGIVGVLSEQLRREGVEIVSLWAGLPHYINVTPNPRGALALIQVLSQCLELRLDDSELRSEAARFEEQISALVASDPELGEYVRQLKRREFAQ